jgi:hypothetical protein
MTTILQALPEQVRKHVTKMSEYVSIIENTPLSLNKVHEITGAIGKLKIALERLQEDASQAEPVERRG